MNIHIPIIHVIACRSYVGRISANVECLCVRIRRMPILLLLLGKLNFKLPNKKKGSLVEWHQDFAFYPHTNDDLITVGIYLEDCDEKNGPLKVIKNKNRLGIFSKSNKENKEKNNLGERGKIKIDHFEEIDISIIEEQRSELNKTSETKLTPLSYLVMKVISACLLYTSDAADE